MRSALPSRMSTGANTSTMAQQLVVVAPLFNCASNLRHSVMMSKLEEATNQSRLESDAD